MRRYKHITFADRKQIAAWYQTNERPADIADRLGVTTATIYRKLKRGETVGDNGMPILDQNGRWVYNPVVAQQTVQENFRRRGWTLVESLQGGFDGDSVWTDHVKPRNAGGVPCGLSQRFSLLSERRKDRMQDLINHLYIQESRVAFAIRGLSRL